jgi:hypothetical protein
MTPLVNQAFTALSVLSNVSLHRCHFSFFLESFRFQISTHKPTYPKLFSCSSSEFAEELCNQIIKADHDWPFPHGLQSIIFSQPDMRPSITCTAESSLLYNTTISHYFGNSFTGLLHFFTYSLPVKHTFHLSLSTYTTYIHCISSFQITPTHTRTHVRTQAYTTQITH